MTRWPSPAGPAECWITDSEGHIGSFASAPALYTERIVSFFAQHLGGTGTG